MAILSSTFDLLVYSFQLLSTFVIFHEMRMDDYKIQIISMRQNCLSNTILFLECSKRRFWKTALTYAAWGLEWDVWLFMKV